MSRSHSKNSEATVESTNLLDDAKALVAKITASVGSPAALTKSDIVRRTKLRKGGETVIPTIAALSDQFGLVVPNHPTTTMVAKIDQAKPLIALHKQLVTVTKQVSDAIFLAQSESWAMASVHYTMLRRLAKTDGDLAKALLPVQQFFAARSTKVAEEQKAKRGGARKGSAKAKAYRDSQKATDAKAPVIDAPAPTPPAPQPAATPTPESPSLVNGAAH